MGLLRRPTDDGHQLFRDFRPRPSTSSYGYRIAKTSRAKEGRKEGRKGIAFQALINVAQPALLCCCLERRLWHKHGCSHGTRWVTGKGDVARTRPDARSGMYKSASQKHHYQCTPSELFAFPGSYVTLLSLRNHLSIRQSVCRFESEKDVPKDEDEASKNPPLPSVKSG